MKDKTNKITGILVDLEQFEVTEVIEMIENENELKENI